MRESGVLKIAVGISGGVDSYNALKYAIENFENVYAVFLNFLNDKEQIKKVTEISENLNVPLKIYNCEELFKSKIIDYFIKEYFKGRTPNPCVKCNEFFKFEFVLNEFDKVITGHYAQIVNKNNNHFIAKGIDKRKDQSYFLGRIKKSLLNRIIFPLGDKLKSSVVEKSPDNFREKKESQEICFIKDNNYKKFITKGIGVESCKGYIKDKRGEILGKHNGFFNFTVGQRKGLNIAMGEPYYVLSLKPESNTVVAGPKSETLNKGFTITDILWYDDCENYNEISVKVRYRSSAKPCKITGAEVVFSEPEASVTPGQLAVFYNKNIIIGSGWIENVN